MRLTLLGTGNAAGMPMYGCDCARCTHIRVNHHLRRGPSCALLEVNGRNYLLDAGSMDIAERFPAGHLDAILLTHFHADHVQGLFHLRWGTGNKIPVYCPPDSQGCDDLFKHPGILDFHACSKFSTFELDGLRITPVPLIHSKPTFGYIFEHAGQRIAYLTDTKGLPPKTEIHLRAHKLDLLVIDTSYPPESEKAGHNNLNETLALHEALKVKRSVLTHIGHDLDAWLAKSGNELSASVIAGYDGYLAYPY